jgi:catechol 2,3-dioxygenase-like lactoylglutathione lyase family enzyme
LQSIFCLHSGVCGETLQLGKKSKATMMKKTRYFDHIDLRVTDLKRAYTFYRKLLPALGFVRDRSSGRWGMFYAAGGDRPDAFFGFTQNRRHRPNGTRIAFWADSRAEVDRIARLLRKIGAKNLERPELCPYYNRGYYACFFEDYDGNKLEICCRENPVVTK